MAVGNDISTGGGGWLQANKKRSSHQNYCLFNTRYTVTVISSRGYHKFQKYPEVLHHQHLRLPGACQGASHHYTYLCNSFGSRYGLSHRSRPLPRLNRCSSTNRSSEVPCWLQDPWRRPALWNFRWPVGTGTGPVLERSQERAVHSTPRPRSSSGKCWSTCSTCGIPEPSRQGTGL